MSDIKLIQQQQIERATSILNAEIKKKGQAQVARELGVSRQWICQIISGKVNVSAQNRELIFAIYGGETK